MQVKNNAQKNPLNEYCISENFQAFQSESNDSLKFKSDEFLNTEEAAAFLRVSVGALRNMTSVGDIPHYKLGRRNRYLKNELRDLLLANKRGGL